MKFVSSWVAAFDRDKRRGKTFCKKVGRDGDWVKLAFTSKHDGTEYDHLRSEYRKWRESVFERAMRIKRGRAHRLEHQRRFGEGIDPR